MDEPQIITADQIEVKALSWLWFPFIPFGKVTVIQGDAGDGKSTLVLTLAAMLSRGEAMPFSIDDEREPINIIYQSSEDDADDTIVPRYLNAGGDPKRLFFISEEEKMLSFSDERLLKAIQQTGSKLVILDPLSAYIGEKTGINSANEIRAQFRPLIDIAKQTGCAVVIIHHMNKMTGQKAINRAVGSVDIVAAARSVLLVARTDREKPDERILVQVKCNIGPTGNAIVFSVEGGRIEWIEETNKTADEVLGVFASRTGRPDREFRKALEMLLQTVAACPMPQREVMEKLHAAGIGDSTAKKAKAMLGIVSKKDGPHWVWSLPCPAEEPSQCSESGFEGSPEGTSGPPPCPQGVVGYTT